MTKKDETHSESISRQFRGHVGLKEGERPDPSLGLSTAKGKSGGKPVDTGEPALQPTDSEGAKSGRTGDTKTAKRVAKKKAEHKATRESSTPKARTAKKTAAKKSGSAKKSPAKKS